jgi:hypothetical protein
MRECLKSFREFVGQRQAAAINLFSWLRLPGMLASRLARTAPARHYARSRPTHPGDIITGETAVTALSSTTYKSVKLFKETLNIPPIMAD